MLRTRHATDRWVRRWLALEEHRVADPPLCG